MPEVLFVAANWQGFEGYLRAVSGDTGRLLWSWPSEGSPVAQPATLKTIAVGDLEGDGTPEVVLTAGLPSLHMVCTSTPRARRNGAAAPCRSTSTPEASCSPI